MSDRCSLVLYGFAEGAPPVHHVLVSGVEVTDDVDLGGSMPQTPETAYGLMLARGSGILMGLQDARGYEWFVEWEREE